MEKRKATAKTALIESKNCLSSIEDIILLGLPTSMDPI
jgi:hypothetical protein